ncbi:hypothetical protein K505DRAFT_343846 [Melanomma pulvis-pyrius CBS 109.77]|uniref:Anaphase-promoting complex subunit 13 n=1 Tax=Melanomma pulvis-pyrius CBS 109.77 TaxID=1314802 RepID=A0A6A6WR43_9PLEO|nr:hypothetical protein K505DRAFT_343846 [Melanomma pulvis-pyrius CBS 109.77]
MAKKDSLARVFSTLSFYLNDICFTKGNAQTQYRTLSTFLSHSSPASRNEPLQISDQPDNVYDDAFYDDDIHKYAGFSDPLPPDVEIDPQLDNEGWPQYLEIDSRVLDERTCVHTTQMIHKNTTLTLEDSHHSCQRLRLDPQLELPWTEAGKESSPADAFNPRSRLFDVDCQLAQSLRTRDMIYRNTSLTSTSTSTDMFRTLSRSGDRSPYPPTSLEIRGRNRNHEGEMMDSFSPHFAASYSTPSNLPNLEALHISSPTWLEDGDPDIVRLHGVSKGEGELVGREMGMGSDIF